MQKEKIEKEFGKILKEFPTFHAGWEADTEGWICEDKDKKIILVLTNHCRPYIAKKEELQKQLINLLETQLKMQEALEILPV